MNFPTKEELQFDLGFNDVDFEHGFGYFYDPPGREHYRLLAWFSNQLNGETIFDIGTYRCLSAFALSYNPNNKVISYDIAKFMENYPKRDNIEFVVGDVLKDERLLKSKLIMMDTLHDGVFENKLYKFLQKNKWKGILLLDDIHLSETMETFWSSIKKTKQDLTKIGHYTGTGYVKM
jgi:hypothetical protein